jgi:predicted deacylase
MTKRLGARITRGDSIATIFDALGRARSVVRAKGDGVLIGHVTSPLVNRGDAVAHVAKITSEIDASTISS